MQWSDIPFHPTRTTLRQFAGLWILFFGGLAAWQGLARGHTTLATLFAVLAAGFWAYVLLFLWPRLEHPLGAVALVLASVIIQLVSPWEQPPPPKTRKLRLHYA